MDIYKEILNTLDEDGRATLATIISGSGSTPVPPGAKMLLKEAGAIPLGTIGGGCVEADVIEAARTHVGTGGKCTIRRFTLSEDDIESGMLCGGTVDILIERLTKEQGVLYSELISRREAGRDCAVITVIDPGENIRGKSLVSLVTAGIDGTDMSELCRLSPDLPAPLEETASRAIGQQTVTRLPWTGGEVIIEPVIGLQDLFIFGGGHVSRYVSRSASMAGFRVTVIDDRPEYANPRRFPEAFRTLAVPFTDSWDRMEVKQSASIVIVTRGHKFDELVLERAVETPARYVGMIGSKRKVLATFSNLVGRGMARDRLQNVRAPIGLSIGAQTAEEIGISVTAELIAVRRRAFLPAGTMSGRVSEFFRTDASG